MERITIERGKVNNFFDKPIFPRASNVDLGYN